MKAVVIYDSVYGNTEKVAKELGRAIARETKVLRASETEFSSLGKFDLIVVGSPTHAGRPTEAVKKFIGGIPAGALKGVRGAAFDTRASIKGQGRLIRAIINFFGYAAPHIAKGLREKGAGAVAAPEGFSVRGREGPLETGELERAAEWAGRLCKKP